MARPQFWSSGDAVYLDLGRGRFVVATLFFHAPGYTGLRDSPPLHEIPRRVFGRDPAEGERLSAVISNDLLPTFMTFKNVRDVTSFQIVPPNDFPVVFGPDVRFRQVMIEMTTDKITDGIEKKLPFILIVGAEQRKRMHTEGLGDPFVPRIDMFDGGN